MMRISVNRCPRARSACEPCT